MPHVVPTQIEAPPEKIALLAQLRAEARKRTDPHLAWLRCARPDQILPGGDWRILYYQGGRGSGKTRSGTQGLAQLIREDKGDPGDWGIIAPTYQAAWTTCVEGPSGILAALGTSMAEIKEHRSATVASAYRTYGEITLHSGHVIRVDSANDGALRVQGKNLKGAYCIAAGEMVTTISGDVPVEQVRPGMLVATRSGWRMVTAQFLTCRDAEVVKLTATDGRTLRLTADHRVWTQNRGWRMASDLTPCDRLVLWNQTPISSSSDRPHTSSGTVTSGTTTTALATTGTSLHGDSTSPSGSTSTSGAFLPGTTFTTWTRTRSTMLPATLNSRSTGSTSVTTTGKMAAESRDGLLSSSARAPRLHGRAQNASSPASSAVESAEVQGRLPSTAPMSAGNSPSSPARKISLASTPGPRWTRRILSGATRKPASVSVLSAPSPTGRSPRGPSTARLSAWPKLWLSGGGRSPVVTAGASSSPRPSRRSSALSAARSATVPPRRQHGLNARAGNASASVAASRTPAPGSGPSTAQPNAQPPSDWSEGSLSRCPEPDGTADVYDLSVAGDPEFFAGGFLIHNCSEIGLWLKWATAWDESIAYAVRLGESKIIACGTPKISRPAAKLIRRLLSGEPGVIVRRLRTVDNLANLSGAFYEAIVARASGTRLERQELEGELLDDVENALWTRDLLHAIQVDEIPGADDEHTGLNTVYVGVDPSDGGEESDEQAFAVVGQGEDYKLYVAESWGGRIGPVPFLKKAVLAAAKWHGTLVVEKNHGGAFLIETLRQVMRDLGVYVPYMVVHASLGKRSRAEPVAAMYERGVVRHLGPFVELEDQMCCFTGAARERSPDRLDALTWACTPFLNYDLGFPDPYKLGAKRWAQSRELDAMAGSQTLFRRRVIAGNYGENTTRQPGAWDLDTFAPQDDVGQGNRPNVKQWS